MRRWARRASPTSPAVGDCGHPSPCQLLNCLILALHRCYSSSSIWPRTCSSEGLHRRPLWEVTPEAWPGSGRRAAPPGLSLLELGQDLRQASLAYILLQPPQLEAAALKEISLFLILCNITVSAGAGRRGGGAGETAPEPHSGRNGSRCIHCTLTVPRAAGLSFDCQGHRPLSTRSMLLESGSWHGWGTKPVAKCSL